MCLILEAIFALISIPLLIPFFDILFGGEPNMTLSLGADPSFVDIIKHKFSSLVLDHSKEQTLLYLCLFIIAVFFLKNAFRYGAMYFLAGVRNGVVEGLRNQLFEQYLALPIQYFQKNRKGDLLARMSNDVQEVESSILQFLIVTFQAPLMIIGCIGYMLYVNVPLTLFVFVLILFTGLIIGGISRTLKKESGIVQQDLGRLNATLEETISGMPVIKSYNAYDYWLHRFRKINASYKHRINALIRRKDLSSPISEFLGVSVVAALLYFGAFQVFNGSITSAVFFSFIFAFYQVINPSKTFANAFYNIQKGMGALDRIEDVLGMQTVDQIGNNRGEAITFNKEIAIKGLHFAYEDEEILSDVNIVIPKGKTVAFVGASGSGKSTLLKVLMQFHPHYTGQILIDGIPLKGIPQQQWRSSVSWVTQEAFLFHDSLEQNILFGRQLDVEDFNKAMEMAYVSEFVKPLENGIHTVVAEKGSRFSGGQKQRISIARALFANPQILLLDEPTSALDPAAEKIVNEALQKAMKGRTSIIVAHRLSTIKNADLIYVFDQGKVVASGDHESLSQTEGIYRKYIEIQNVR